MSVLIGDVIMAVRSIIPDMPTTYPAPALPVVSVTAVAGSTFPAGTYYVRCTVTTPWGESSASPESTAQVVTPGSVILLTGTYPLGATTLRVYFGPQGAENQYIDFTSLPATITVGGTPVSTIPNINRAYLPDTDGVVFPATTIFGWLRDGLKRMGSMAGAIYDTTGINTTPGYAMYQLLGSWRRMSHAWVDGWPYELANKGEIFYRNKVTTTGGGIVVTDIRSTNATIEYYPIPARGGGNTTSTSAIAITDTDIPCTTLGGYLLEYGLAQLGSGPSAEIIAYQSLNGTSLSGCLRGLGGTRAAAWPINTPVLELNGRFAGYRYPYLPQIGDSLFPLDCPPDWDTILQLYMESRYREAERRFADAKQLRDTFTSECRMLASSNRDLMGPKQIGDNWEPEGYGSGAGGRWLIP